MKKFFVFSAFVISCLALYSQAESNSGSTPADNMRIVCAPVANLNGSDNVAPLVMNHMPVAQAIELLQRLSGRTILLGSGIPDVRLNFNSGDKISRVDAIFALENLLSMHGVQLSKVDEQFVRAVPASAITRSGPSLVEELEPSMRSGQVHSRIFPLEYLSAQEANRLVAPLLSGGRGQSAVITLVRNNSLLVIDTLSNLQFIQTVLKDADKPGANRVEVYSVSLAHTPVREAFRFMTQLQRTSHQDVFRGTTFYQDSRTNQLVVSTNPAHIEMIRKILEEFDQDVAPLTTSRIYQIRHANVSSVNSILNSIVNNQRRIWNQQGFMQSGSLRESTGPGGTAQQQSGQQGQVEGEEEIPEGPVVGTTGDLPEDAAMVMMDGGMPQLQFSPYLSIFMDRNSSQIVAYGTEKDLDRLAALIENLDKETAPFTDSELIYLKYANTMDVARTITQLINAQRWAFGREGVASPERRVEQVLETNGETEGLKFSQFAIVVSERRSNALLVYGTQNDLTRVKALVDQLDVEAAPLTETRLFRFQYADASTAANIIARVVSNQRASFGREGILDTERRREMGEEGSAEQANLVFSSYITLTPDRRANALLVYGTQQDMLRVEELIKAIDVEAAPFTQSRVVYLKHSQATTIGGILNNLINQQRRSYSQQGLRPGAEQNRQRAEQENSPLVQADAGTEFSPFASVVADQRINALLLYGTGNDLISLGSIVEGMDIPVDPLTKSEVFQLRYAQSTNLVSILNTIIRGQQQALRRVASASREIRTPGAQGSQEEANQLFMVEGVEPMQFSPYVTLVADRRSNTILGYGTDTDLAQIRELIEKTDIEVAPITRSKVFEIQHGESNQVVQTLQTLISSQQRVRERESTLRRVFSRDSETGEETIQTAVGGESDISQQMIDGILDGDEGFQFSPYISLVSDQRSNSVVAYGTSFDLEQVEDLIKRIDVVLPQVRIEVVIAEVALTGDMVSGLSAFGFQYRDPLDPNNPGIGDLGFQMSAPAFDGENQKAFSTSFTLDKFSLSTVFNVAKRDRNVRVLSAPTIVTTHNRQAQINVGQAFPIVTSTITGAGNASDLTSRATVEYRDIGIELRVRPLIGTGSNIQMEIEQVVETVVGTQTISENVQPIIGTRRASSFISVRDQEVIVLGGLQSVDTAEIDEKVFLLGDLPLIGGLFRPRTTKQEVRELIIFIKPYVVEHGGDTQRMAKEELEKTAVGREIEYYLREGRFPEQTLLKEANDKRAEKQNWPVSTAPVAAPQRVWQLPEEKRKSLDNEVSDKVEEAIEHLNQEAEAVGENLQEVVPPVPPAPPPVIEKPVPVEEVP